MIPEALFHCQSCDQVVMESNRLDHLLEMHNLGALLCDPEDYLDQAFDEIEKEESDVTPKSS